jgi:acetate CoA/acetoacetate CoA-transferase alpha subunit
MIGGFYAIGTPENIVDEILRQGKKDLTVINNDGGNPNSALGRLLYPRNVKKVCLSWCGYLSKLPAMVEKGEIELELNPQGTLIERIRAGGFGLGGS